MVKPCLRKEDKRLARLVADDAQKAAQIMIDNAEAEKDIGNVADWVRDNLRIGRARLKDAMTLKERLESIPDCD